MDGLHINSGSVLISTKRHGQGKQNHELAGSGSFECSKQSILSSMDKFVRTVQSMNGTILVPSRLRDMRLRPRLPDCKISLLANSRNGYKSSNNSMVNNNDETGRLIKTNKHSLTSESNTSTKHSLHSHHFHNHLNHLILHNHRLQDYHVGFHPFHSSSTTDSTRSLDSTISGSNRFLNNATGNLNNNRLNYDPAEIPSALMNADLYNFYSMLYDVKQQLLWGPASGQSTIFTNYNANPELNQSNNSRFMTEKPSLHQLNSRMANCNLNSDNQSVTNSLTKNNRAESTCSSGYSSNSSTRNSTTNLSFIAQYNNPTTVSNISNSESSTNSLSTPLPTRPSSAQTSLDESQITNNVLNQCTNDDVVKMTDSSVLSTTSDNNLENSSNGSPQSKTPQSDSDLESELESDSILTDRTSEPITDQTQLLASAFRHHLQALHTILDQLTHSAEYLSRSYELELGEGN